ncbi:hypothetical protein BKA24_000829 [Microbacterium marinum]|uniref:Uncharacterized protein n=1 Tax=Microbacterium marinum TaxID=421115 RepID=A0A7W7BNY0_9MICO|nr:hypothetical protein [Microbacterium marinum]MBB4666120.1 hypothetical protein [Microbacterium marinum]
MPTGPKHTRSYDLGHPDGSIEQVCEDCRCMIGDDHNDSDSLSAYEAEDIYMSSGMDKDDDFR